jgi:hypothetical protein
MCAAGPSSVSHPWESPPPPVARPDAFRNEFLPHSPLFPYDRRPVCAACRVRSTGRRRNRCEPDTEAGCCRRSPFLPPRGARCDGIPGSAARHSAARPGIRTRTGLDREPLPSYGSGNVLICARFRARPGPRGSRELPAREISHEQRQRTIEDLGQIAARHGVAEQILCGAQLFECFGTGREPDLVALGGQRADDRAWRDG